MPITYIRSDHFIGGGSQLHDLAESHRKLVAQANRWKGALALLLALGALAGWLVNQTGGRLVGG